MVHLCMGYTNMWAFYCQKMGVLLVHPGSFYLFPSLRNNQFWADKTAWVQYRDPELLEGRNGSDSSFCPAPNLEQGFARVG